MRIVIGANHRGFSARGTLVEMLRRRGDDVVNCGVFNSSPVDYPEIAIEVAGKVSRGNAERGILIGGMGFGMAIAANKFPGVRRFFATTRSPPRSAAVIATATSSVSRPT